MLNKAILIGNIATDIDLKYTQNGNAVANFNLAINDRDEATFLPIEVWKKTAENVSQYCGKGSKVAVEGSIKIDEWEKDGQKRRKAKVVAFNIQFLDPKTPHSENKQENTSQGAEQIDLGDNLPF